MTILARLGIRIEAHGDRLRYSPRSAVTPDLADRMKAHKAELLAILHRDPNAPTIDLTDATAVWQAALDRLSLDQLIPRDVTEALRATDAQWADDTEAGGDGDPTDVIDSPAPCQECKTLELWQTLAGNWRCLQCDPPTRARRLRERAARIRQRQNHRIDTRQSGQYDR